MHSLLQVSSSPLHPCRHPWWTFLGTAISGIPGSFVTKTAPSPMVPWPLHIVPSLRFEPLSSCSFLVFKTSSTWGLLPINKLGCQLETQLWCLWSTASVLTLREDCPVIPVKQQRFHFSDRSLLSITAVSGPGDQHTQILNPRCHTQRLYPKSCQACSVSLRNFTSQTSAEHTYLRFTDF